MLRKAREARLLEKISYSVLLDDLSSVWRMANSPEEPNRGQTKTTTWTVKKKFNLLCFYKYGRLGNLY